MSEEKQQTIGEELSAARQARGLELEEIQRQSGVSLSVLQGIEAGELDVVESVFVRLALKTYAEHLDLDPEPFLSRFDQQYGRIMQARSRPVVVLEQPTPRRSYKPQIIIGAAIGTCCVLAVALFYFFGEADDQDDPLVPPPPPQSATPTPTPLTEDPTPTTDQPTLTTDQPTPTTDQPTLTADTPTPLTEDPTPTTDQPSDPLPQSSTELEAVDAPVSADTSATVEPAPVILELEARDSTWVQIRWDDEAGKFETIVPPGERRRFEARDHFVVLSTRPHGLSYWLDGQLLGNGQLGDPDQVLYFRAAADGIEFLTLDSQPSAGEAPDAQP